MLVKAVLLFLLVMVVIAMLGNAMFPGAIGRGLRRRLRPQRARTCPDCGRPRTAGARCACGAR